MESIKVQQLVLNYLKDIYPMNSTIYQINRKYPGLRSEEIANALGKLKNKKMITQERLRGLFLYRFNKEE